MSLVQTAALYEWHTHTSGISHIWLKFIQMLIQTLLTTAETECYLIATGNKLSLSLSLSLSTASTGQISPLPMSWLWLDKLPESYLLYHFNTVTFIWTKSVKVCRGQSVRPKRWLQSTLRVVHIDRQPSFMLATLQHTGMLLDSASEITVRIKR